MKLTSVNVLKFLNLYSEPKSLFFISTEAGWQQDHLEAYIRPLVDNGYIQISRHPYSDDIKYSPERLEKLYSLTPLASEYIRNHRNERIALLCTIIAAVFAILSFVVSLFSPTIG